MEHITKHLLRATTASSPERGTLSLMLAWRKMTPFSEGLKDMCTARQGWSPDAGMSLTIPGKRSSRLCSFPYSIAIQRQLCPAEGVRVLSDQPF